MVPREIDSLSQRTPGLAFLLHSGIDWDTIRATRSEAAYHAWWRRVRQAV